MGTSSDAELLGLVNKLHPVRFENLTLDLLRATGFRNIIWRTPGADGGRDMQAEETVTDLSGTDTRYIWYVECKHYSNSVDWPTLWKKVSYADSQSADFLLLVTNSQPSPQCETEIRRWNENRRRPGIRVWRGYDLPMYLRLHEDVALAHGLITVDHAKSGLSLRLTEVLSKLSQAAYGAWAFELNPEIPLVSASTLSELFHQRMHDITNYGRFVVGGSMQTSSIFPWLMVEGDIRDQEEVGFKATVAAVRHVLQAEDLHCKIADRNVKLIAKCSKHPFLKTSENFLKPTLQLSMCDSFKVFGEREVEFTLRTVENGR